MFDDDDRLSEGLEATALVGSAQRVARTLTVGFGLCEEDGFPLSERQQIALLTAALLGFEGFQLETRGLLGVERILRSAAALETARAPDLGAASSERLRPTAGAEAAGAEQAIRPRAHVNGRHDRAWHSAA